MTDEELAKALYEWFGRDTEYKMDGCWDSGKYCMAGWAHSENGTAFARNMTDVSLDDSWDFIELAKFIKGLSI